MPLMQQEIMNDVVMSPYWSLLAAKNPKACIAAVKTYLVERGAKVNVINSMADWIAKSSRSETFWTKGLIGEWIILDEQGIAAPEIRRLERELEADPHRRLVVISPINANGVPGWCEKATVWTLPKLLYSTITRVNFAWWV
jgi:hypothetical protein